MGRRYAVLGFRNRDGSLGFALSANPLSYLLKNRTGEYATRAVSPQAHLLWAVPQASYDFTVALRNQLNELDDAGATALIRDQTVPEANIERLRALSVEALPAYESDAVINADAIEAAWALLPSPAIPTLPFPGLERIDLDDPLEPLPTGRWSPPSALEPPMVAHNDTELFIFDLDDTLVDSSALLERRDQARQQRDFGPVRDAMHEVRAFTPWRGLAPHELPGVLHKLDCTISIVSRSPKWYVDEIIECFGIEADEVIAACGYEKVSAFRRAIERAQARPETTWVFGDDGSDFRAADYVGCSHLGNPWLSKAMSPQATADIAWFHTDRLLAEANWRKLAYIGELEEPSSGVWHRGSMLSFGEDALALGRYFKRKYIRNSEPLSLAILEAKDTDRPHPLIAPALAIALERLANRGGVDLVVTIPPHAGKSDRFTHYRRSACGVLNASDAVNVRVANPVPPNYKMLSREHKRALRPGRFVCHDDLTRRTVLVIDDVTTTGSTTGAMSDALYEAGAARVIQLVWGVTQY